MIPLLQRELVFVSGKGGVGKSTIAAALGLLAAESGRRTLVCEVDAKGSVPDLLGTGPVGFEPREAHPNLFVMEMDTEASLQEYLSLQLRLPFMARVGPLARVFEFASTATPGVKEILTVGKLCWEVDHGQYDVVITDAAATGHIVSQLAAPQAINQLVQVGLVRQQTGWMLDILSDPARTGLVLVATPEEMPVNETIELAERVRAETTVDLAAVVVNRVLPELFGRREEATFDRLSSPEAVPVLDAAVGAATGPLLDAARLALTLRRTRAGHLERLRSALPPAVPTLYVPELFTRSHGLRAVRQISAALAAEMEG